MIPQLVALTEGPNLLVDKPILLVGRHQECDVQIPSRKISRKHCCIAQVDDHLVVRDLFSTNGVKINGAKVPEGKLQHGDELTIGNMQYRVEWPKNGASKHAMEAVLVKPAASDVALSSEEPIPIDEKTGQPQAPAALPLALPVPRPEDGYKAGSP
jgi:predicted component of type VI protein secretion system